MKRMDTEQKEHEELMRAAEELQAKSQAEAPKSSKGTLPKGF